MRHPIGVVVLGVGALLLLGASSGSGEAVLAASTGMAFLCAGVGIVAACLFAGLAARRAHRARERAYARVQLVPGRADEATPERVARLLEGLHGLLVQRWWRRLLDGQPGICLEVVVEPSPHGPQAWLSLAMPDDLVLVAAVRARLAAAFRDLVLVPSETLPDGLRAVVRCRKRRPFILRLRTPDDYRESPMDALLATMGAADEPAVVQYALVPCPAVLDRLARWRFRSVERDSERARLRETGDPGVRGGLISTELDGALRAQHRPLFFCDVRIAATTRDRARQVARALRGETAAENRLDESTVRHPARVARWLGRVHEGRPNPVPDPVRGVVSTPELSGMWQLPSPWFSQVALARNAVPRVPAPQGIARPRDARHALARDAIGSVGLRPADRYANLGLVGPPGAGKSSVLLRSALADAADPGCALILLDPKGGLADQLLGLLPDTKPVHVISLAACEAGLDPFHVPGGTPQTIAAGIVSALKGITEDGQGANQIGFSSDRYIRQGAIAIAAAEPEPDLWKLWRLLNASEEAYRELIAARLTGMAGLEQTQLFLGQELPHQLAKSPANFISRLDAPMNKAIRTTTGPLDVCFRHPHRVDIDEVIARREILILDGSAGRVETDDVAVVMQFAINLIHNALLRQQALPEPDRARVALTIDEAHLGVFSTRFTELLALGRSSGLECTCAFQSPGQIADRALRAELFDLLGHWAVFGCGEETARDLSGLLQTAYSDVQRDDPESRERQRITTDALINLPRHWFAASWLAHGARQAPFIAQTLPMDPPEPALAERHRAAQRGRGGRPVTAETLPVVYRSIGKRTDDGLADDGPPAAASRTLESELAPPVDDRSGQPRPQPTTRPTPRPAAAPVTMPLLVPASSATVSPVPEVDPNQLRLDLGRGTQRPAGGQASPASSDERRPASVLPPGPPPASAPEPTQETPASDTRQPGAGAADVADARRAPDEPGIRHHPDQEGADGDRPTATPHRQPAACRADGEHEDEQQRSAPGHVTSAGDRQQEEAEGEPRDSDPVASRPDAPVDAGHEPAPTSTRTRRRSGVEAQPEAPDHPRTRRTVGPAAPPDPVVRAPDGPVETLAELDAYARPRGLRWEPIELIAKKDRRDPTEREKAILCALAELKVLSSPQIHRRLLPDLADRSLRHALNTMARQGWLRRCHLHCEGKGHTPRVFALTQDGFDQIAGLRTRYRPFFVGAGDWRPPELAEDRRIVHDLHANAWMLAFEHATRPVFSGFHGPRSARLFPPSKPHPEHRADPRMRPNLSPAELAQRVLGTGQRFDGIDPAAIAPIWPDGRLEIHLPRLPGAPHQHYLIEMERSRRPAGLKDKLARYDALLTAWARTQEPYASQDTTPLVVFVCPSEPYVLAALKIADEQLAGRIASLEDRAETWPYPGRRRMLFVAEADIHRGSLRAFMVAPVPANAGGDPGRRAAVRSLVREEVLDAHR